MEKQAPDSAAQKKLGKDLLKILKLCKLCTSSFDVSKKLQEGHADLCNGKDFLLEWNQAAPEHPHYFGYFWKNYDRYLEAKRKSLEKYRKRYLKDKDKVFKIAPSTKEIKIAPFAHATLAIQPIVQAPPIEDEIDLKSG